MLFIKYKDNNIIQSVLWQGSFRSDVSKGHLIILEFYSKVWKPK